VSPALTRPIRWALLIPPEVQCEYAGISQAEYYTDLEQTVAVCRDYPARFEAATGYRPPTVYATPSTAYEGLVALGGELVLLADHQPMLRNQTHIVPSAELVDALRVPDPWQAPRFQRNAAWNRELKRRFGSQAGNLSAGQEGPVTTAVLLRGQDFFMDCVLDPPRAHRVMEVCTEMFIRWTQAAMQENGTSPRIAYILDDHAGLLGPDLWPTFVLPYYRRIIEALGPEGCWMHSELLRREHLPLLRDLGLVEINFAEDQYLTIQDVQAELPGVPFGWHILCVSEMLQGTPELIRRRYREIVAAGVQEVRCELTVGTPPENIRAFLEMARAYEGG